MALFFFLSKRSVVAISAMTSMAAWEKWPPWTAMPIHHTMHISMAVSLIFATPWRDGLKTLSGKEKPCELSGQSLGPTIVRRESVSGDKGETEEEQ